MSELAVGLLVEVVVCVNARCTAHGATGSALDAKAAELQPGVFGVPAVWMHVDVAKWPMARHMAALVPDIRVLLVISALVAQLTVFGADASAGVRVAFGTYLHSIVVAALHLRVDADHHHRRPDTCGGVEHREVRRGPRGRGYLRVHEGVPECG